MTSKTITDRAGDTLRLSTGSLTAGPGEITIKVTERFRGRETVAAVHVDPAALRAALDGVAPLGKYTRTTPDPDDMDGGVAAALIEKEAEKPDLSVDYHAMWWKAEREREKAERERDEARATKDMHKRRADEERARADAAESRPLTPDAVTDEMVYRGLSVYYDIEPTTERWNGDRAEDFRRALVAALTEPPARPEGAEDIDEHLRQANAAALGGALTPEQRRALADHLAGFGYRNPIALAEVGLTEKENKR